MSDIDAGTTLALAGSRIKPMLWLTAIIAIPVLIIAATLGTSGWHMPGATTPQQARLYGIAFVCLILGLLLLLIRGAGVCVRDGILIIRTSVGSKRIPLANLRPHGLRIVNLSEHPDLRPIVKRWGTGLPGFAGGWFGLRNGDKAVCLLLDRSRVSCLRSDVGKLTVLLSLAEPEKLRALLER